MSCALTGNGRVEDKATLSRPTFSERDSLRERKMVIEITKRLFLLKYTLPLCLLAALTACASNYEFWYKVNSVPNSGQSELTDCQVYAAQTVPANTQVGQNPTYVTPTNTNCYAIGTSVTCSQTGGNVYGGDVYSYDANAPLRQSVITNCMNKKGYFYISLPECKTDDIKNG